nr:unnamed protein product [Callosobruchus analis]
MLEAKALATVEPSVYIFSFDLEKALSFPILTCSLAYYKRNCYVYNFGCHELTTDRGYMYCWHETRASRGSQEISSCIRKHVCQQAAGKKQIIAYSDACTGQNRNIKTSLMWIHLMGGNETRRMSGHSFLPNGRDFGNIRRRTNRKKNTDGHPVYWLKIQWLRFRRDASYTIFYKETLREEFPFSSIDIKPASKGRPPNILTINLQPLYKDVLSAPELKKRDISLLQTVQNCPSAKKDSD